MITGLLLWPLISSCSKNKNTQALDPAHEGLSSKRQSEPLSRNNFESASIKEGPRSSLNLTQAAHVNAALGISYLKQGDVTRAKSKLLKALELDRHSPEVNAGLAYFYEMVKDYSEAESYYKKTIKLSKKIKKYGASHNNYAAFLCRRNRYKEAQSYFNIALADKKYVGTADVYENYGLCAKNHQDDVQAEACFKKALDHDPSKYTVMKALSDLYQKQKKPDLAKSYAEQYEALLREFSNGE